MMKSPIKTLFLTRYLPYPPVGGSALRNWQNINVMQAYGPVYVVSICPNKGEAIEPPGVESWENFILDKSIEFWENYRRKLWPIRRFGYPDVDRLYQQNIFDKLKNSLAQFNPDIVIVGEIFTYHYLKLIKQFPGKVILDNHNIEADLLEQNHGKLKLKVPRLKAIEKSFVGQADQVWVCSEDDKKLLHQLYGKKANVYSIPNTIDVKNYNDIYQGKESYPSHLNPTDHNILFLGQYNYSPNSVAASILIEDIYPQIKEKYPDTKLLLVGRNPSRKMRQASQEDSDIIVTGSVPDVRPYLAAASVMVVPLQTGGGTRLKILEALAAGLPVISTAKGAEGLSFIDKTHLLISNKSPEIVDSLTHLWSDQSLMTKLRIKGRELVEQKYSWLAVKEKIDQAIQSLILPN
ncbi:MAG: glycosyltransferase family 4 protein [Crocosphaera sp.]